MKKWFFLGFSCLTVFACAAEDKPVDSTTDVLNLVLSDEDGEEGDPASEEVAPLACSDCGCGKDHSK